MRGAGMGTNQLLDSLTDHLALYHRQIGRSQSVTSTKGSPREKVLEWLRGLTIDQRQATLTITDKNWVSVLLQMQKRLEREGAGYFFVLTDVLEFKAENVVTEEAATSRKRISKLEQELDLKKPQKSRKGRKRMAIPTSSTSSRSCQDAATGLPGLCFRKAKGLLARLDEQQVAGELLAKNMELSSFGEVSADEDYRFLDTLSVSEDLVTDVDQFLAVLDVITYGEFLTSLAGRGNSSWEELPWLKAMGYYTLPAFVANKLELSLWSAWLQSEGARRLPRTLTKELRMAGWNSRACPSDASSLIICKRNKGFSGWWTSLTKDVKSSALRYAVARAAKVEVMQTMRASCSSASVGRQENSKSSIAQGRLTRRRNSLGSDSEQWGARLAQKEDTLWSFLCGLDALRKLTASPLLLAFSEGADVNESTDIGWLFHSHLDLVDTLPGRIMQRVRAALKKVMLESTELELLRNESCRSQDACSQSKDSEGKMKKENRRKKFRNSVQSKVLTKSGSEVVSEKQLENNVSQVTACSIKVHEDVNNVNKREQYEHEQGMKLEVGLMNRKQNMKSADRKQGKKKKHSRAKLKAANENCLNVSIYEEKDEPSCKVTEERNVETEISSGVLVYTENILDSGTVDFSSPELSVSGNRIQHCAELQTITSHSEHLESMENEQSTSCIRESMENEKSTSFIVEDHFPAIMTDSRGSTNVKNHDNCTSLSKPSDLLSVQDLCEEKLQTELSVERNMLTEITSDVPLQTAAMRCRAEGICNKVNSRVPEKVDAEQGRVVCELNTIRKVCKGIDNAEAQCVLPPADNQSFPGIFSRSSCPSPIASDIYSQTEGLKPQLLHSHQNSAFGLFTPHEWPGAIQVRFPGVRSHIMPPATERLHLDVGRNWQRLQASLLTLRSPVRIQQPNSGSNSKRISGVQNSFKSVDCPPMFPTGYNFTQARGFPFGFREEPGLIPLSQPSYSFGADFNVFARGHDESKHDDKTPEDTDYDDSNYFSGDLDDYEGFRISEEEGERQFLDLNLHRKGDYNQIFGGGVMYWNTTDYSGMGYSRPPSLSSEDSSWARHEADLSVVLDDSTVLSPMSGTFANGASPNIVSTSPPTASYHPSFDPNAVSTTPRMGLPTSGNDFPGKFPPLPPTVVTPKPEDEQNKGPNGVGTISVLDGLASDIVPRPLRPIIVVRDPSLSRQVSVSESLRRREARSPHVPCGRREIPRRRRPPSPVLRCVPPAPPPPPPSPVGGFGKRKGMTTVRSGSSSPRRWSLANCYHKEELDNQLVISGPLEAATNSWRSRSMADTSPWHSISGTLLRERLIAVPPLALEQEHPDVSLPMQTALLFNSNPSRQSAITMLHSMLHEEIEGFCNQVVAENLLRKPFITMAVHKVAHALQVLWPRSRVRIFGSNATGLALPCSDVDLVVCLPPVRNLEPIKEAGILEGRNGIKETCLQHAARYLADQDWVKGDTLKTIENTAIPIIMLVAHVPSQLCNPTEGDLENSILKPHLKEARMGDGQVLINANGQSATTLHINSIAVPSSQTSLTEDRKGPWGGKADREVVRLDISFEAPSHTGLQTAELVQDLTAQFPAIFPLALVLKQFLTDRSLDHPYTGGLSSYCLVLLITRFLQHQHHLGWPFQQNLGSLLMDFLHFFGCVFDPRRMGVCIRGGGMYVKRDRGHSIDPLHIEDPLHPSNNVGRNCFRILQCVKAFADAYSYFEKVLLEITETSHVPAKGEYFTILPNILPSVASMKSMP